MRKSLETSFVMNKKFSEETEIEPATPMKKKATFNRQYKKFSLKYRFIVDWDFHALSLLCLIGGDRTHNAVMNL